MTKLLQRLVEPRVTKKRSFLEELKAPWKMSDSIRTAIFAALYIAITMAIAPIAYGMFQIRISEAIGMVAYDSKFGGRPTAIGVVLGGVIVSLFSPNIGPDTVIGFLSGVLCLGFAWWAGIVFKGSDLGKLVTGLVYTFITALFVGIFMLNMIFGLPAAPAFVGVMIGELISALALGFVLLKALERTYNRKKKVS